MNEVKARIKELKHIRKVAKRNGYVPAEQWAAEEIAEMKVALKRNEKALAGTRA